MKKLRTKAAAELDRPSTWHRYMRPWMDIDKFQQRINERIGLAASGQPILRLVWGQDINDTAYGRTTPRYWTKRRRAARDEGTIDNWLYYRVPRWIFEYRMEPEQYAPAWEAARWSLKDENGVPQDRGPYPEGGYYIFASLAAEHEAFDSSGWPACCTRAFYEDRRRCWGRYRPVGDFDLNLIEQAWRRKEAEKFRDPYRELTPAELAELELMANMQAERVAEQQLAMERQMAADFYGLPLSAIPDEYGRRKTVEIRHASLPAGYGRRTSGIVVPQ